MKIPSLKSEFYRFCRLSMFSESRGFIDFTAGLIAVTVSVRTLSELV